MSPAIVKLISALWGGKTVGLSLLAKSTGNQSHGLGHRDLALGIKGEGGGNGHSLLFTVGHQVFGNFLSTVAGESPASFPLSTSNPAV